MRFLSLAFTLLASGLLAAGPDGPSASELAGLARSALSKGHRDLAIYYYRQASLKDPRNMEWRTWLADAYLKRGNLEQAEDEAKAVLAMDASNAAALAVMAALVAPTPTPVPQEVADAEISSVPFPEPAGDPLPNCVAAWVYGEPAKIAEKLNPHNLAAAKAQAIGVVFIPGGELSISTSNGKVTLALDFAPGLDLAERLAGDVRILPVLKGRSQGAAKVGMAEWERVGAELGALLEDDRRLSGLAFDLTPHDTHLYPLFAMVKKNTRKPVVAMVREWNKLLFKYVDVAVLKCFELGSEGGFLSGYKTVGSQTTLQEFVNVSQPLARSFLLDARNMDGKAFIGVPAAANATEFESVSEAEGQPGLAGVGLKMYKDYFINALFAIERAMVTDDPALMGVAINAIHPAGGVLIREKWYHPSEIPAEIWERMKAPLVYKR